MNVIDPAVIRSYILPPAAADLKMYRYDLIAFGILLLLGLALIRTVKRHPGNRFLGRLLLFISLAGAIIYIFRYEEVVYFDAAWWIWAWFIALILGLAWYVFVQLFRMPRLNKAEQQKNLKQKYLPKPRRAPGA